MKRVLALLLCVLLVLSLPACKKKSKKKDPVPTTTASTTVTTEATTKLYAPNEVINRLFVKFMNTQNATMLDSDTIRRAPEQPDMTVYLATINECQVTVTDVSNKTFSSGTRYALQVDIVGGVTDASLEKMLAAFIGVAMAADSNCSKETAQKMANKLQASTEPLSTITQVCQYVYVANYSPAIQNDYATQPCRISLLIKDPLVTATTSSVGSTTTTK